MKKIILLALLAMISTISAQVSQEEFYGWLEELDEIEQLVNERLEKIDDWREIEGEVEYTQKLLEHGEVINDFTEGIFSQIGQLFTEMEGKSDCLEKRAVLGWLSRLYMRLLVQTGGATVTLADG